MRGLTARDRAYVYITRLLIQSVHALIGTVGLLLGEERTEAAITHRSDLISRHTTICAKALHINFHRLHVGASSRVVDRVEVAYISGHANIFPSNVEKAQLSKVVYEQVAETDALHRLL